MATKKVARSAKDGEFVSAAEAEAKPDETVVETVEVEEPKTKKPSVAKFVSENFDRAEFDVAARAVEAGLDVDEVLEKVRDKVAAEAEK
jgi:succinyl-CoA synthetase beta subunit